MKLEQLQATISHYPTQPGSLVLLRCPPGTPEDALEHVGRALHEWGVNNGLFIFGVIGELDIEVLGPEDLAKLGLRRAQP